MAGRNHAGSTVEGDQRMSRTFKDRKRYKTRMKHHSYTTDYQNRTRGGYEDYDHSDQELYVYDQCCENCRYYNGGCCHENRYGYDPFPPTNWCEDWKGFGGCQ